MKPVVLSPPIHPDWREVLIAENQKEKYIPLPSVVNMRSRERHTVTAWELDDDDVSAIILHLQMGRPFRVFLTTLTFGDPFQPVILSVVPPTEPWKRDMPPPEDTVLG